MKLSQSQKLLVVAFVSSVLTFLACGGGHSSPATGGGGGTPPPPSKARADSGVFSFMHPFASKTTTSYKIEWSLVPKAYAQTTSISLSQSFNGICNLNPTGQPTPISFAVYGLGQTNAPNCSSFWTTNDSNGSSAAANAQTGQLIIGNGTLTNLVAWTSTGTTLTGTSSGQAHLYVRRGSQTLDTGISCTLGAGSGYMKCGSTTAFQVLDGDLLIGTLSTQPGDTVVGFNMVATKA